MADKKKQKNNKSVSNKKPVKHTSHAQSDTRPRNKKPVSPAKKKHIRSLIALVCGFLLIIFFLFPDGFFSTLVKEFLTGLIGWPAFILPLLLIVGSLHSSSEESFERHRDKYTLCSVGIGFLSVFLHILTVPKASPFSFSSIASNYEKGSDCLGGGVLGGFVADLLRLLIGQVASVLVMITAFLILTMMFVDWSPVKLLFSGLLKTYQKTEGARVSSHKRKKRPAPTGTGEQTEIPEDPEEIPEDDSVFPNFPDEAIGVSGKRTAKAKKHKGKMPQTDASDQPSEDEIPSLDEDALSGIDSILDEALPQPPEEEPSPVPTDADAPVFPMPTDHAQKDSYDEEPPFDADETEQNIVDAPKRLEGMEDVSEEIDDFFERIPYTFPSVSLLECSDSAIDDMTSREELRDTAQKLIATLKSFNVETKLLTVSKGPTVTRYELMLGEGIKVSKVVGLTNDLALRLAASSVRIEPVPGKDAIGIEIPNKAVSTVSLKEVIDTDEFKNFPSPLAFAMGKDISGKTIVHDLARMPHVLIAGSTGSGKSVCINTLITSIIYKADPNDVKLLMVDPKVVELGVYNGIPHLLIPVVTEPRRASGALYWAVQEMLRRYALFADNNVRNISGYNQLLTSQGKENTLPHIVIIIDELADLMMVAPAEVEDSICRLAQMARAAGMHLVVATQRPSADVLTGLIKANVPSRIAFAVSSHIDSRIILDMGGADKLLGKGDMLFKPIGSNKPTRIQGAFVSDAEVERVVEFIKGGTEFKYDEDIIEKIDAGKPVNITDEIADPTDNDELLPKAIELAVEGGKISASHLQRRLKVGFGRAARMIDQMEERGIVGPPDGSKPREVLITKEQYLEMSMNE